MKSLNKRKMATVLALTLIMGSTSTAVQQDTVTKVENAYKNREKHVRNIEVKDIQGVSQNLNNIFGYNPNINLKSFMLKRSKERKNRYDLELIFRETDSEFRQAKKIASRLAADTEGMDNVDTVMYLTQAISMLTEYNHEDLEYPTNFSPYGVVEGRAVCNGYTYFLEMALAERGIRTSKNYVKYNDDLHIYNTINIEGNNYGIDITHADKDVEGKVDWSKIFFNKKRIKEEEMSNFVPLKTLAPLSNIEFPIPSVEGLVSIKDSKIYTDTERGLMGYNYKTNEITFEFPKEYYQEFYVIGDDLIIHTTEGDLINKGQKILATNVNSEDIIYNHSTLYVNGELKYRNSPLSKDKSLKMNSDFKVNLDEKMYTQQSLWEGISVFQGDKFIMEFTRR